MRAFHDEQEGKGEPRTHPWKGSIFDPSAKFIDCLKEPELIRPGLEDFAPYVEQPAIERFFRLIELMCSANNIWETTESYLWPPVSPHSKPVLLAILAHLFCAACVFNRVHAWQCRYGHWAFENLLAGLQQREPTPPNACVGVFTVPTLFLSLAGDGKPAPVCKALGIRCYGFGANDDEAFDAVGLGVDAVREVTHGMAKMIETS